MFIETNQIATRVGIFDHKLNFDRQCPATLAPGAGSLLEIAANLSRSQDRRAGFWKLLAMGALLLPMWACGGVPKWQHRQAQLRSLHLYRQGRQASLANGQLQQELAVASGQSAQYAAQLTQQQSTLAALQQNLEVANQRLANLGSEREQLHQQYTSMLASRQTGLPGNASKAFEELARKYPDFQFDPVTGVSHFNEDILFPSGSDEIGGPGQQILREFAGILNGPDTRQFQVLVVGHTDDRPVVKPGTKAQHETNWELSAHRATSVVRTLAELGLSESRLGFSGYSMHQPAAANSNESSRQRNRRVEIYVLAPENSIAGRDAYSPR